MSYQEQLDLFAGLAMQSWLLTDGDDTKSCEDIAALAYEQAEAMMAERGRRAQRQVAP